MWIILAIIVQSKLWVDSIYNFHPSISSQIQQFVSNEICMLLRWYSCCVKIYETLMFKHSNNLANHFRTIYWNIVKTINLVHERFINRKFSLAIFFGIKMLLRCSFGWTNRSFVTKTITWTLEALDFFWVIKNKTFPWKWKEKKKTQAAWSFQWVNWGADSDQGPQPPRRGRSPRTFEPSDGIFFRGGF